MNRLARLTALALVVTAVIAPAAAVDYKFYPSSVDNNAIGSEIYFTGLNQSTGYELVRGDGENITSFTSTTTGVANVTFDFKPLADGYNDIDKEGLEYKLVKDEATISTFNLHPAFFVRGLDEFNDDNINNDLYTLQAQDRWETNPDESNGRLIFGAEGCCSGSPNRATFNYIPAIEENQKFIGYIYTKASDSDYLEVEFNDQRATTINIQNPNTYKKFEAYYDSLDNEYIVRYGTQNKTITNVPDQKNFTIDITSYTDDGITNYAEMRLRRIGIVPQFYNVWNVTNSFSFSQFDGVVDIDGFTGHLNYSGGVPEFKGITQSQSSYTSQIDSVPVSEGIDVRTRTNSYIDYLALSADTFKPPEISNTVFTPSDFQYRSDVNFETTVTDSDGVVDVVKYDVYADGAKIVDNETLAQTSNPDRYETVTGFNVDEDGATYEVVIKAWDNDGNKASEVYTQDIPAFVTDFEYTHLGVWDNYAITPEKNATGFTISWEGYNSSKTNYTYATLDVYLESLDRELDEDGYDVELQRIRGWQFTDDLSGDDIVNGSNDYNITFDALNDYEKTKKVLGDRVRVIQQFQLRNESGDIIKVLEWTSEHETLQQDNEGFFAPVFDAIGAALRAVGDFLGITDLIEGLQTFLGNILSGISDAIGNVLNAITDTLAGILNGVLDGVQALGEIIWDVLVELYIILTSILAAIINAITIFLSYLVNIGKVVAFHIGDYGLTVEGELYKNNQTFTYYNYTGDTLRTFNETNATFMDGVLLRYELNATYTSIDYVQDRNITSAQFKEDPIFSFGNTAEIRDENVTGSNITVNEYTWDYGFPDGISLPVIWIFAVVSAFLSVIFFIYGLIPEPIRNAVDAFFRAGGIILGLTVTFLSVLTDILNFVFVDGLKYTIMFVQYGILFKAMYYFKHVSEALDDGGKSPSEAIHVIITDLEEQYVRLIEITERTYNLLDKAVKTILDVLKTISGYIPFT